MTKCERDEGRQLWFTAVYVEGSDGVVVYIEELLGALAQGRKIEEARTNLAEPARLVLLENRLRNQRTFARDRVLKREAYAVRR